MYNEIYHWIISIYFPVKVKYFKGTSSYQKPFNLKARYPDGTQYSGNIRWAFPHVAMFGLSREHLENILKEQIFKS